MERIPGPVYIRDLYCTELFYPIVIQHIYPSIAPTLSYLNCHNIIVVASVYSLVMCTSQD